MQIIIRPAQKEDAEILAHAEQVIAQVPGLLVSCPEELTVDKFQDLIVKLSDPSKGHYIVAQKDNVIVGHALLNCNALQRIAHIAHLTIAVHSGFQGQGIGTLLLGYLIDWARQSANIEKIILHVRSTNARAIALYKKFNFVEEGRFSNWVKIDDAHYIDDIIMALNIIK